MLFLGCRGSKRGSLYVRALTFYSFSCVGAYYATRSSGMSVDMITKQAHISLMVDRDIVLELWQRTPWVAGVHRLHLSTSRRRMTPDLSRAIALETHLWSCRSGFGYWKPC